MQRYLTDPDTVWRIQPQWFDFSGTSAPVRTRTQGNFLSSGFQILAWSMPRLDLDSPEAALKELGKAYELSFQFDGWVRPGGAGSDFPSQWNLAGTGLQNQADEASFVDGAGPEVKIFQSLTIEAKPIPMKILDQSLVQSGLEAAPDEVSIEELVRTFWKTLEAFDTPPENLGGIGTSLTAPGSPPNTQPTGRFSDSSSGGSFP